MTDWQPDSQCPLCRAERITRWFHEDDQCWVAECEQCDVPMVVWKRHDPNPPEEVRVVLFDHLSRAMREHYSFEFFIDDRMRSIPGHFHAHARDRRSAWAQRITSDS